MRIACVVRADQLTTGTSQTPDVVVFPEGISLSEIGKARLSHPNSILIGAIVENGRSRGVLFHGCENKIDYLKIETDGHTQGSGNLDQQPIYELPHVCIGVIVCMDVNCPAFSRTVIEKVRSSQSELKLICIPADMTSDWFGGDAVAPAMFGGIHVVLCNHTKTHQQRCRSFVTDLHGSKIIVQNDDEPIFVDLRISQGGLRGQI